MSYFIFVINSRKVKVNAIYTRRSRTHLQIKLATKLGILRAAAAVGSNQNQFVGNGGRRLQTKIQQHALARLAGTCHHIRTTRQIEAVHRGGGNESRHRRGGKYHAKARRRAVGIHQLPRRLQQGRKGKSAARRMPCRRPPPRGRQKLFLMIRRIGHYAIVRSLRVERRLLRGA